jgi:carboxyl-terminal processing protease
MFMDNKEMVTAMGRSNERSTFKTSYPEGVVYDKPLVLLTDGLSASASEVLAGGLHDNCRAAITGAKTFGKGKIQAVFGLSDGEGLTLTVAQYVTPTGTIIQSRGLQPDIPSSQLNPYLSMMVGPKATKPDLNNIDFKQAESIIKMCQESLVAKADTAK